MSYCAQIDTNNICVAVSELAGECPINTIQLASYDQSVMGKKWNGTSFVDVVPPVPAPIRILSKLEYMNRFTDAELAGIYTAAKSIIAVEIWFEKFKLAGDINLDDPRTVAGLQAMEAAGLLVAGRASEILA
jgi:hypothetical protein